MVRRARTSIRLLALCTALSAAATTGALGLGAGPASARSVKTQIADAQHQLAVLDNQAESASERYNAARISLATAQRNSADASQRLAQAQARVRTLQRSVSAFAVAAYRGEEMSSLLTLADGSASKFVDRISSMQAVSESQSEALAEVGAATRVEQQAQSDASAAVSHQRVATASMQADRNQVLAAAAKEKTIINGLQAREAAIIKTAKAKAARQAAERAAAALRVRATAAASAPRALASQSVTPPHVTGSGGARVAVEWAYKELGKPYQWGAAGPNSFDCSGLTMYVWAKAGVHLDHYTGSQWNEGTHVSQSQLEPGDLVFFGSDLHHVGLYIGGGKMIEAPYTGANVRISPYDRPDYAGAVRP